MRAGFWEILLIVVLVLILFGHNKIPTLMKNLANGINVFKKEIKETKNSASAVIERGAAVSAQRAAKRAPAKKTAAAGASKKTAKKSAVAVKSAAKSPAAQKKPARRPVKKSK